jgi:hypothetical protein
MTVSSELNNFCSSFLLRRPAGVPAPGGTALGVAVLTDVNCSFGRYESP